MSKAKDNGAVEPNAAGSDELPEGWSATQFDNLFIHVLGGDWGVAPEMAPHDWVDVSVIRGTEFRDWDRQKGATAAHRAVKEGAFERRELKSGDLVIEVSGGGPDQPVGRPIRIDDIALKQNTRPLICSNFCRQVRLSPKIDSTFVLFCLKYLYNRGEFNRFQNQTVNLRNLQFPEFAAETTIPLPPLNEQKRIVAKVEALLERVGNARERLSRVPDILREFRQSVLAAACSGRLTAEWRESNPVHVETGELLWLRNRQRQQYYLNSESRQPVAKRGKSSKKNKMLCHETCGELELDGLPELPDSWAYGRADEIVEPGTVISYGIVLPDPYVEGGVAYIRGQDIDDNGRILVEQLARTTEEIAAKHERSALREGDVLLCVIRNLRVAIVPAGLDGVNLTQGTVRLRPSDIVSTRYLAMYLASPHAQGWMKQRYIGLDMPRINVRDARAIPIALPPIAEQQEIVRQADALVALCDSVERQLTAATGKTEHITQSVLAKAFSGELVETEADLARREGRDYEPASMLLKRIARQLNQEPMRKSRGMNSNGRPAAKSRGI